MFGINFQKKIKIAFDCSNSDIDGVALERLWAAALDSDRYLILNSPFNVYGISYKDVVSGTSRDGEIFFTDVIERGGHSTLRVKLNKLDTHARFVENWSELKKLGCSAERCSSESRQLYSIDVPPEVSVDDAISLLAKREKDGVWEYEEAHIFG